MKSVRNRRVAPVIATLQLRCSSEQAMPDLHDAAMTTDQCNR
jgi:hypothetical protein